MPIIRSYGDTDFITGLRALAASMVVAVHTAAFVDFGPIGYNLSSAGKYGVQMFFVIAGFTIAKTYYESTTYQQYITRRLFRIGPPYYLAIFVYLAAHYIDLIPSQSHEEGNPDYYNILLHISFLSFLDYRVSTSIMGVEWTIPIEVFCYFLLPRISIIGKDNLRGMWIIFSLFALLSIISKSMIPDIFPKTGWHIAHFTPFSYLHYFVLGAIAFWIRKQSMHGSTLTKLKIIGIILFLAAILIKPGFAASLIGISTFLIIVSAGKSDDCRLNKILTTRTLLILGSISYSIYLYHPLVIKIISNLIPDASGYNLIRFISVLALTSATSFLTYRLFELPSNALGKKLATQMARTNAETIAETKLNKHQ